ncbi:MAG: DsbA family oxidoreductase [Pseudomonadota bacterium]|nr:DsbA family oxidoreductase [Pseudomonadota bacterium]MEC8145264.1 DsbA family oxidoreductase [Pseudomonadota bacterium]MEC8261894.1 DsbA family oxidoreductase [Pseudomonadota bacterium]MED5313857.1 DsbA family oxidoreductase [Pseudomonadota bacterium]MEE3025605.1 DsbA family oxidoreductase [Pseudomonadota bacterium]
MQDQTPQSGTRTIQVEIYADVICPWCYIGKRRLDLAFAQRPEIRPAYVWRAFLLNPTMPSTGMDRAAYLSAKFGNSAAAVYGRIAAAGLDSGIDFRFDSIKRTPDSRLAHRMLIAAGPDNAELSEAIYSAYFIDGLDIGSPDVLCEIADRFERPDLIGAATDEAVGKQLEHHLATANRMRLDGVPYFIFAEKYAVAGAHLPEHLVPAIDAAAAA